MANGDKPPGNVSVSISSPHVNKGITIPCHDAEQADKIAGEVVAAVEKIQKKYAEKG